MRSNDELVEYLRGTCGDEEVVRAFARVDRAEFLPLQYRHLAYADTALPLFNGQTISQPTVVCEMLSMAELARGHRVLEVGTGSGYTAALTFELTGADVYSVEYDQQLAEYARTNLSRLGYTRVHVRVGDGTEGWPEHAPYDRAVLHAAVPDVPPPVVDQVVDGGIIVAPVGTMHAQVLTAFRKEGDGIAVVRRGSPVVFVPMRGKYGFK